MTRRLLVALATVVIGVLPAWDSVAAAQSVPRTPDGRPDLQGVWTFATATPLERPKEFEGKEFLTPDEVAEFERQVAARQNVDEREEASIGTDADVGRAYNQFWWDRGTKVVGTRRTSLIVDPKDGRMPAYTAAGQERADRFSRRINPPAGPEDRNLWERCITHSPIPRMSTGYNNNLQIVQTAGYVAIEYEMIHEVRIVPLDGRQHIPKGVRQWLGDSRGHWEGDTLVVETTNFSEKTGFRGASPDARLIERFTRLDDETLDYRFTIEDPATWARPWTVSAPMPRLKESMYEYTCHEGNYGLTGQLAGARAMEAAARKGSQ